MSLSDRVKNIITTPRTEWLVIAAEPATVNGLFKSYAMPVALLPVAGTLIGALLLRGNILFALVTALLGYAIGLAILYGMGIVADALAPSFDGRRDRVGGMKLVVYAATAQWVAGFFGFIPGINLILALAGFVWGAYLIYLGSRTIVSVPEGKSLGYTAVLILIWILLGMVVGGLIVGAVVASMATGMTAYPGAV